MSSPPQRLGLQDNGKFGVAWVIYRIQMQTQINPLGFIHAIPEEEFNMATVTIIDITFFGFFPKKILQALRKYEKEIQRFNDENNATFKTLIDNEQHDQ